MNKQQLLQHLQDIEWDNFEVKTARTDIPKDIWETVSAFANTSGGWVYFSPMKPRIRVFTNRIEFENPGSLPRPVEELLKADESLPRNPVLVKFFRIAKLCESAGFGFDKMLEWKKQTGNEVIFETTVYKTKFTFMLDVSQMEESGMKNTENYPETTQKTDESGTNNIGNYPENQKTTRKQPENRGLSFAIITSKCDNFSQSNCYAIKHNRIASNSLSTSIKKT